MPVVEGSMIFSVMMKRVIRRAGSSEMQGSSCLFQNSYFFTKTSALCEKEVAVNFIASFWGVGFVRYPKIFSLPNLGFVKNRTDSHRTKMFVFSYRSVTKDEGNSQTWEHSGWMQWPLLGTWGLCWRRGDLSSSRGHPLIMDWEGRSSVWNGVCHSRVFESGVKYPAGMLVGQPHPVVDLCEPACPI